MRSGTLKSGARVGPYTVLEALSLRDDGADRYLARRVGAPGFSRAISLTVIEPPSMLNRARALQALHEGTKLASAIEDPRLARVEDVGEDGTRLYAAEEHVGGRSVLELLEAIEDRALPVELATHIALEAALALHAVHEALDPRGRPLRALHRGVSPATVHVSWRGHVKLVGLGLIGTLLDPTAPLGDAAAIYRAPEHRTAAIDGRGDVYSLALVLVEAVTGDGRRDGGATQPSTSRTRSSPAPTAAANSWSGRCRRPGARSAGRCRCIPPTGRG